MELKVSSKEMKTLSTLKTLLSHITNIANKSSKNGNILSPVMQERKKEMLMKLDLNTFLKESKILLKILELRLLMKWDSLISLTD